VTIETKARGFGLLVLMALLPTLGNAQPANPKEAFETATIRPWVAFEFPEFPCTPSQKPKPTAPGQVLYSGLSLRGLVMAAYDLRQNYQLSGPSGINTKPFTVEATSRPNAADQQIREMLQNLLAERFRLTLHWETRVFETYELTAKQAGPKLRKSVQSPNPCTVYAGASLLMNFDGAPTTAISPPADTFIPASPGIHEWRGASPPYRAIGGNISMEAFADYLSRNLAGRPVIDQTGLADEYDFNLDYRAGPALLTDVEEQLGLKMTPVTRSLRVLVVDQFQPTPTEVQ